MTRERSTCRGPTVRRDGTAPGSAGSSFTLWVAKGSSCAPTRRPASPTVSPWTTGRRGWSRSTSRAPSPARRSSRSGRQSRPLRLRREQRQHRQSQLAAGGLAGQALAGAGELARGEPAGERGQGLLHRRLDRGPRLAVQPFPGLIEHLPVQDGEVLLHLLGIAGEARYASGEGFPVRQARGESGEAGDDLEGGRLGAAGGGGPARPDGPGGAAARAAGAVSSRRSAQAASTAGAQ